MRHASVTVDPAALRRWYVDDRLAMAAIAIRVRCGSTTIGRRLRAAGIPVRPRGPVPGVRSGARRLPAAGEAWTSELAYAVGLIATDGNLSRDGRHLSIPSKDRELLESLKSCLGLEHRITEHRNGKRHSYRLQWSDRVLYDWLVGIGLHPAKSLTLGQLAIPDARFPDFFRGCIDGDGSIVAYTDRFHARTNPRYVYRRLYVVLFSASRPFVDWIRATIRRLVGVGGSLATRTTPGRHPISALRYAKRESVRVLTWMYASNAVVCLARKRAVADAFLSAGEHGILARGRGGTGETRRSQKPLPARA